MRQRPPSLMLPDTHVVTAGPDELAALLGEEQEQEQAQEQAQEQRRPAVRRLYASRSGLRGLGDPAVTVPCVVVSRWPLLAEVDLSGNQLQELPPGLGALRCLRKLYLQSNRLQSLPADLCAEGCAADLRELWVDHNELTELPADWSGARRLVSLHCGWNRLTSLPEALATSTPRVVELLCQSNELRALPPQFGPGLPELRCLALRDNQLTALPDSLGDAPSLCRLLAGANPLGGGGGGAAAGNSAGVPSGIPFALGLCPMQELYLSGCGLRALPEGLQLYRSTLRWMDVSDNMLEILPSWVADLNALRWVDADHNMIAALPRADVARRLAWLAGLSLGGNPIVERYGWEGLDPRETVRAIRAIDWEEQQQRQQQQQQQQQQVAAVTVRPPSWVRQAAEEVRREWCAWRSCCCLGGPGPNWATLAPSIDSPGPCIKIGGDQMVYVAMPRSVAALVCIAVLLLVGQWLGLAAARVLGYT